MIVDEGAFFFLVDITMMMMMMVMTVKIGRDMLMHSAGVPKLLTWLVAGGKVGSTS